MTQTDTAPLIADNRPDALLTRDEVIARNLSVVEAHFHNENPDDVEKAIALYTDDIVWEAPTRGLVYDDPADVLVGYRGIFETVTFHKTTHLRRFATEQFVFDDQIADVSVIGEEMPNLPYPVGTRMSVRLVHVFEMRDGRIAREIAYEMWRKKGSVEDRDDVPTGAIVTEFPPLG